jgi:hypothetical protein
MEVTLPALPRLVSLRRWSGGTYSVSSPGWGPLSSPGADFIATLYRLSKTEKAIDNALRRHGAARMLMSIAVLLRIEKEIDAAVANNSKGRTITALADWRDQANLILAGLSPNEHAELHNLLRDSTTLATFAKSQIVGAPSALGTSTYALRETLGDISRLATSVAQAEANIAARGSDARK